MRIRAAVLEEMGRKPPYATSRPLTISEVELAPPGPGEVLVKIAAAGLCHSDLSVIDGSRPRPTPMALGHEASAIVEETGPGVDDLAKGDHAVLVFVPSCGHCLPCATGRPALCEPAAAANGAGTLLSGERRLSRNGAPLLSRLHSLLPAADSDCSALIERERLALDASSQSQAEEKRLLITSKTSRFQSSFQRFRVTRLLAIALGTGCPLRARGDEVDG